MTTISLREATNHDEPALTKLFESLWLSDGYPASARTIEEVGPIMAKTPMTTRVIAIADDEIVGHVALRPTEGYPYTPAFAAAMGLDPSEFFVLCRLCVHSEWRRQGLGARLIEYIARDRRIALDSIVVRYDAQSFYRGLGFVEIGTVDYPAGGVTYEKTLWVDRRAS